MDFSGVFGWIIKATPYLLIIAGVTMMSSKFLASFMEKKLLGFEVSKIVGVLAVIAGLGTILKW